MTENDRFFEQMRAMGFKELDVRISQDVGIKIAGDMIQLFTERLAALTEGRDQKFLTVFTVLTLLEEFVTERLPDIETALFLLGKMNNATETGEPAND